MSRRQNRPAPSSVKHPGDLPEPEGGRHMSSMDRDAITRALTAQACHAGLSGADLRVWMAVVDRTLTWRWLSDVVSHKVLRNVCAVERPGRSLDALVEAGLIHYRPGKSRQGKTTLSALIVRVPEGWERYRNTGIVWWGEEPRTDDEDDSADPTSGPADPEEYGRDGPHPMDGVIHTSMDEVVHTYGPDDPHPLDRTIQTGVDGVVHQNHEGGNHEESSTRDAHEGGDHKGAASRSPHAGESETPTSSVPSSSGAEEEHDHSPSHTSSSAAVVGSDNGAMDDEGAESAVIGSEDGGADQDEETSEADFGSPPPPRPGWSLDRGPEPDEEGFAEWLDWSIEVLEAEDPTPEPPRIFEVGEASAEAAVKKFAALGGVPLAPATIRGLTDALRPMECQCRGAEMLMALGWWQERGRVRYPQDVAEHLTAALLHPHLCDLDPVNGMDAHAAIEEGRCRYRWAEMPEKTLEQFVAKMRAHDRATDEGLQWPLPRNVRGVLPPSPESASATSATNAVQDPRRRADRVQDPRRRESALRLAWSLLSPR